MSVDLLVQHPIYKHLLKFSSSTDAREKILRLLQYFVRFLRFWKFRSTLSPELVALLPSLQNFFTMARKPLRVLKPLNNLKALSICISDELSDPVLRYSEAIKQFGLLLFFGLDLIQLPKMLGLLGGKGVNENLAKYKVIKNANKYAAAMWCLSIFAGITKNLRQFQMVIVRYLNEKNMNKSESEINQEGKPHSLAVNKIQRDFVKNILDMVIASNMYGNFGINDGIIGGFGVITSILGLQDLWNTSV
ncbi:Peroxisomal membrane protein PMP27 [Pichia californica]|uniref:Peroxisomal membrane protein PMP27 n=1 Tax=Pichia californica TaxID=460514 RepID=A0A9P6WP87_9ASCO|nr:Peroxisomal membrane protein PMP27 [[Candida] californica]KAG0690659.1 Peroxisomal membrane protein PMP27 [[Candida] californica]